MAKTQDSVTTVQETDEPQESKKGRFSRGRRKKADGHSATEWVDTLHAAEDAQDAEPTTGSPFAAGDDPVEGLPEEPEASPEVDAAAFDKAPPAGLEAPHAAMSEEEALEYERSWKRRHHEGLDDIHHFVDNVIGTSLDPARRRRLGGREVGIADTREVSRSKQTQVRVEGLDEEFLIAFTFPEDEFRGAHVVYETEGGYVLDVRRAIGGDDNQITSQYYTVSRMGEVSHVIDKMRERDHAMRNVEMKRMEREHGSASSTATETTTTETTTTRSYSSSYGDSLPDAEAEALPESFGQPELGDGADAAPEAAALPPLAEEAPAAPEAHEAPQVEVGAAAPALDPGADTADADAGPEGAPAKKRFSLRRKRSDDAGNADEADEADAPAAEAADAETDAGATEPSSRDDTEGKKRGIFRFKKGGAEEEEA